MRRARGETGRGWTTSLEVAEKFGAWLGLARPRLSKGWFASRKRYLLLPTDALGNVTTYEYDALDRLKKTTYADGKVVTRQYNREANIETYIDPRGFKVEEQYDNSNRMVHRTVVPDAGVTVPGALEEEYRYDGLSRPIWARSGNVIVERGFDSMSRLLSAKTGNDIVGYEYDPSGNPKTLTYPSGRSLVRRFDGLNRPTVIGGIAPGDADAWYGYRGPARVGTKGLRNNLAGTYSYDAADRPAERIFTTGGGAPAFQEALERSPRGFKVGDSRSDQNGAGFRYVQDAAGRLLSATRVTAPLQAGAESDPALRRAFASLPSRFEYQFDAAENLLSRTASEDCEGSSVALPLDGSGRNRPASVGSETLEYDAAGNLVRKGDLRFEYDFRDRLVRVTNPQGEVARYDYDAFDRRVTRTVGGRTFTTVWDDWQAIEEWEELGEGNRRLRSRRTYGAGLDEIVLLETDLDGDGTLELKATPLYDETGNLVALTRPDGSVVERYLYSPFGEMWALVDDTPPAYEQVRLKGGAIWIEMSEEVSSEKLQAAIAAGSLKLVSVSQGNRELAISVTQPVRTGRQANRRLVISVTDPVPPEEGNSLELRVAADALVDLFGHAAAVQTFSITWTNSDLVLVDATPPRVELVCLGGGTLKIQFSEEVDLARAATALQVDSASASWTLSPDRYSVSASVAQGFPCPPLIEMCRLVDTLLIDHESIYDPRLPNDRFLLGLKGSFSEYELDLLRQRSLEARYAKAERGDLVIVAPVGYIKTPDQRLEIDPDLRVQQSREVRTGSLSVRSDRGVPKISTASSRQRRSETAVRERSSRTARQAREP